MNVRSLIPGLIFASFGFAIIHSDQASAAYVYRADGTLYQAAYSTGSVEDTQIYVDASQCEDDWGDFYWVEDDCVDYADFADPLYSAWQVTDAYYPWLSLDHFYLRAYPTLSLRYSNARLTIGFAYYSPSTYWYANSAYYSFLYRDPFYFPDYLFYRDPYFAYAPYYQPWPRYYSYWPRHWHWPHHRGTQRWHGGSHERRGDRRYHEHEDRRSDRYGHGSGRRRGEQGFLDWVREAHDRKRNETRSSEPGPAVYARRGDRLVRYREGSKAGRSRIEKVDRHRTGLTDARSPVDRNKVSAWLGSNPHRSRTEPVDTGFSGWRGAHRDRELQNPDARNQHAVKDAGTVRYRSGVKPGRSKPGPVERDRSARTNPTNPSKHHYNRDANPVGARKQERGNPPSGPGLFSSRSKASVPKSSPVPKTAGSAAVTTG